jgi:hypothetical protein
MMGATVEDDDLVLLRAAVKLLTGSLAQPFNQYRILPADTTLVGGGGQFRLKVDKLRKTA